jgi:hypothetical protein
MGELICGSTGELIGAPASVCRISRRDPVIICYDSVRRECWGSPTVSRVAQKVDTKNTPVRFSDEAIRWSRIASGYTGESTAAYASRIVAERGREDVERLHALATSKAAKRPKTAR